MKTAQHNSTRRNGNRQPLPLTNAVAPRKLGRPPKSSPKIDLEKALKLRLVNNLSYAEIAARFGVVKSAVEQRLKRFVAFIDDPEALAGYRANRGDVLDAAELRLLTSLMDEDKLLKASLNNVAYSYQQVANQRRLEQGKTTQHIGVLTKAILDSDKQPSQPIDTTAHTEARLTTDQNESERR